MVSRLISELVSSIVGGVNKQIVLLFYVGVDDWTSERANIASDVMYKNLRCQVE